MPRPELAGPPLPFSPRAAKADSGPRLTAPRPGSEPRATTETLLPSVIIGRPPPDPEREALTAPGVRHTLRASATPARRVTLGTHIAFAILCVAAGLVISRLLPAYWPWLKQAFATLRP